jgi:hypothetical protein
MAQERELSLGGDGFDSWWEYYNYGRLVDGSLQYLNFPDSNDIVVTTIVA